MYVRYYCLLPLCTPSPPSLPLWYCRIDSPLCRQCGVTFGLGLGLCDYGCGVRVMGLGLGLYGYGDRVRVLGFRV